MSRTCRQRWVSAKSPCANCHPSTGRVSRENRAAAPTASSLATARTSASYLLSPLAGLHLDQQAPAAFARSLPVTSIESPPPPAPPPLYPPPSPPLAHSADLRMRLERLESLDGGEPVQPLPAADADTSDNEGAGMTGAAGAEAVSAARWGWYFCPKQGGIVGIAGVPQGGDGGGGSHLDEGYPRFLDEFAHENRALKQENNALQVQ